MRLKDEDILLVLKTLVEDVEDLSTELMQVKKRLHELENKEQVD